MNDFLIEAATFLLRWLHVVAAIAWIGESFYFVALDRGLRAPAAPLAGLSGESWSVHGGGFYLKQKFLPAPPQLPEVLHWSKWKSYTTWISGFALLAITYLLAPQIHLIDPAVARLTNAQAVLAALALLLFGWLIYDAICRVVGFRDRMLGASVGVLTLLLCYAASALFAGRAAFLLVGAVLATIMSANVFFVIIPGQKRMVAALQNGAQPDPLDGARGKQRSVHNTYFTLPVVFAMLSTHYASAYAHPNNGLVLALFMAAGALIRQFFVLWHSGGRAWGMLGAGAALLGASFALLAPKSTPADAATRGEVGAASAVAASTAAGTPADTNAVAAILGTRCNGCHSATPRMMPSAPKGALFDTPAQIDQQAEMIHKQTVVLRIMPPGNLTQMTDEERALIDRWFRAKKGQ